MQRARLGPAHRWVPRTRPAVSGPPRLLRLPPPFPGAPAGREEGLYLREAQGARHAAAQRPSTGLGVSMGVRGRLAEPLNPVSLRLARAPGKPGAAGRVARGAFLPTHTDGGFPWDQWAPFMDEDTEAQEARSLAVGSWTPVLIGPDLRLRADAACRPGASWERGGGLPRHCAEHNEGRESLSDSWLNPLRFARRLSSYTKYIINISANERNGDRAGRGLAQGPQINRWPEFKLRSLLPNPTLSSRAFPVQGKRSISCSPERAQPALLSGLLGLGGQGLAGGEVRGAAQGGLSEEGRGPPAGVCACWGPSASAEPLVLGRRGARRGRSPGTRTGPRRPGGPRQQKRGQAPGGR